MREITSNWMHGDGCSTTLKRLRLCLLTIPFDPQRRVYNYAEIVPEIHPTMSRPGHSLPHDPNSRNGTDDKG